MADFLLAQQNNLFLIDWLTFTTKNNCVEYVKTILGLNKPDIPWMDVTKFRNGYPQHLIWEGITISYGADNPAFYQNPSMARNDMGICVNLSGRGCRQFESYGSGDWMKLLSELFDGEHHWNVTRLDLAYDDHIGILDIYRIAADTRDRYYTSKSRYSEIVWSDNLNTDIQGMTVQIGSDKSDIKIRIYDKAAERGFDDRHWIRVELQLRRSIAYNACGQIIGHDGIGPAAAGILKNYLVFTVPVPDTHHDRWPPAPYWDRLLLDMQRLRLWTSPGEEYNWSKTECWLINQCGQALQTAQKTGRLIPILEAIMRQYPEVAPKYQQVVDEYHRRQALARGDSPEDI